MMESSVTHSPKLSSKPYLKHFGVSARNSWTNSVISSDNSLDSRYFAVELKKLTLCELTKDTLRASYEPYFVGLYGKIYREISRVHCCNYVKCKVFLSYFDVDNKSIWCFDVEKWCDIQNTFYVSSHISTYRARGKTPWRELPGSCSIAHYNTETIHMFQLLPHNSWCQIYDVQL